MLVLLKSDMAGEDGPYTIGAIELPRDKSPEAFEEEARAIMDSIRTQPEYEDEDLLTELEHRGYRIVDAPYEIVVRD